MLYLLRRIELAHQQMKQQIKIEKDINIDNNESIINENNFQYHSINSSLHRMIAGIFPTFIGGDFNSTPASSLYTCMNDGAVDSAVHIGNTMKQVIFDHDLYKMAKW
jgi:hypothetical protein